MNAEWIFIGYRIKFSRHRREQEEKYSPAQTCITGPLKWNSPCCVYRRYYMNTLSFDHEAKTWRHLRPIHILRLKPPQKQELCKVELHLTCLEKMCAMHLMRFAATLLPVWLRLSRVYIQNNKLAKCESPLSPVSASSALKWEGWSEPLVAIRNVTTICCINQDHFLWWLTYTNALDKH